MKCPYKNNQTELTNQQRVYDEESSGEEITTIVTKVSQEFGDCDYGECAAYRDNICQFTKMNIN